MCAVATDLKELFEIEDITEKIEARLPKIEEGMKVAKEYLNSDKGTRGWL